MTAKGQKGLSDRKRKILSALIDDYIFSAEPVSSGIIQRKYLPEVSSATIRSELAALEALGYVEQPHTSAGRVPLPAAYKLYCESLADKSELTEEEMKTIESRFGEGLTEVEELSQQAAKIISDTTNYTSVIVLSDDEELTIKEIKLVPLSDATALVVIRTDKGVVANRTISLQSEMRAEYIEAANSVVSKVFAGKRLSELDDLDLMIGGELESYKNLFDEIMSIIRGTCAHKEKKVYIEGALKMLDNPDYDKEDAKNFLQVISDADSVATLVGDANDIEFSVKIGRDDDCGIDKCAIVTAEYKVDGKVVGKAGVIGPERMDYKRVMSVLDYIKKALSVVHGGVLEGEVKTTDDSKKNKQDSED